MFRHDRLTALAFAVAIVLGCAAKDGTSPSGSSSGPLDAARRAGLTKCAPGTAFFTVSPIALSELSGWVPLGNLNPPGHLFPTDHQYLYHTNPDAQVVNLRPVNVVAPGTIIILNARRSAYSTGNSDYSLDFMPCEESRGSFGHMTTLTSSLLTQLGPFDQFCDTYSPNPGLTVTQCSTRSIAVRVTAGELLGTTGNVPGVFGFDFSLWDNRIAPLRFANASRWSSNPDGFDNFHVVAASDYFAEPARSQIAAKVGSFDGRTRRTIPPIGGTIELDVPGTAQGAWFNSTQPTHPEGSHLAIAPDNVDPNQITVSMGLSQPGFNAGQYRITPTTTGTTNRHPAQITLDGQMHCYRPSFGGVILLQLVDATTLRVEGRSTTTMCAFTFTPGATFDYKR